MEIRSKFCLRLAILLIGGRKEKIDGLSSWVNKFVRCRQRSGEAFFLQKEESGWKYVDIGEEKFQPRRDSYSLAGFSLSSANLRSEETNDFQSYDAMHACISPERGNIFVTIVIQSVFLPSKTRVEYGKPLDLRSKYKVVARYRGFMEKEGNLLKIFVLKTRNIKN